MQLAGLSKTSFVDYPGRVSAVVFTPYCNMNCWYCHNRHILIPKLFDPVSEETVFEHLRKRRDVLGGVVITGGEPTLQPELKDFILKVRELGLDVKLDTNGLRPEILESLVGEGLLSYIAMDVKAPPEKYDELTGVKIDYVKLRESISIIMSSGLPYEFRTTFAPTLTAEDILKLAEEIKGAKAYYLQQYRSSEIKVGGLTLLTVREPHSRQYVLDTAAKVKELIGVCETRGI